MNKVRAGIAGTALSVLMIGSVMAAPAGAHDGPENHDGTSYEGKSYDRGHRDKGHRHADRHADEGTAQDDAPTATITDIVSMSGGEFDRNRNDYDILLNAVVTAGLAETLAAPDLDVTVWAPNDRAFKKLARDLGWQGRGEADAWAYLVDQLTALGEGDPIPVLTAVLTYHVTPGVRDAEAVLTTDTFPTLQGGEITRKGLRLIDADPDVKNPKLVNPLDIKASNGIIHTINRVLLPIDL